jgi:cytochrome c oxidase subunit II
VVAKDSDARSTRSARRAGRLGRVAALGAIAIAATVLLSGCSFRDGFALGWPKGISVQSRHVYDLWTSSVIAALAVGALVWGLIFWCIVRYHKRGDELPVQTRYNLPIEMIYSVVPFLIIAVLFFYTVQAQNTVDRLTPSPAVTVNVVAFKWNWQFVYEDANAKAADGTQVSTTGDSDYIPVLVVPTGETIRFVETSRDVIHSFWVPDLLFKRDVFPGNVVNKFQVNIDTPGAYVGRCAEFCGTYHSQMNFELRAVSPTDYQRFIAAKVAGLSTPQALQSIGQAPYAVTTHPFNTSRTQSNFEG